MGRNSSDAGGRLDGTAFGIEKFLREMAAITGQRADLRESPVLELRFGDVLTLTSLIGGAVPPSLRITALLPRRSGPNQGLMNTATTDLQVTFGGEIELLWHTEKGCYVMMRNMPVAHFPDERSVLDAILHTADKAWEMYLSLAQSPGCRG